MEMTAPQPDFNNDKPLMENGNHVARCFMVVDLGLQDSEYEGKQSTHPQILIGFEYPEERAVFYDHIGEQPFTLTLRMNWYTGTTAKFRKTIESWRGKAFTDAEMNSFAVNKMLDAYAVTTVVTKTSQKGNDYQKISNIASATKRDRESVKNKPYNENILFSIPGHGFDSKEFRSLWKWIQDDIMRSHQYRIWKSQNPEIADALEKELKEAQEKKSEEFKKEAKAFKDKNAKSDPAPAEKPNPSVAKAEESFQSPIKMEEEDDDDLPF